MRLAALAVVGFLGASTAIACDEEGGSIERAAQVEKEAQALLEQGRKAEGAKLMAKAWALRAEAWSADGERVPGVADVAIDKGRARNAARLADLEAAARAAKEAGREAEAAERMAEIEKVRAHMRVTEKALADRKGDLGEWRMKVAALKAKSEALEREGKAAKAAGDEAAAKEKMAASGRVWKEAEALERAGRDGQSARPLLELRVRRAEIEARIEEMQRSLNRIEAGMETGGEARKEELRAKIEAMSAEVAAIDEKAKRHSSEDATKRALEERIREERLDRLRAGMAHSAHGDGLANQVERLRAEVAELREVLRALRAELEARAAAK
jgi:colicin import membrane protein